METMREGLQNMAQQLGDKQRKIKQLIHINKEGYNPEADDHKSDISNITRLSWMSNSVKNGLWTFGRSKFSSPGYTLADTKKAKIDLVISASSEIERLRSIIRTLSTSSTPHKNGSING